MSTPNAPRSTALTLAVVAAVTLVALGLIGAVVGLYALAPAADRPSLSPLFGALAAGIPGVFGAALVYFNSRRQHAETTGAIDVVRTQTNGVLSERMINAVSEALARRDAAAAAAAALPASLPGGAAGDAAAGPAPAGGLLPAVPASDGAPPDGGA
jgi:ABC-type arginine transport system permease subunit